MFVLWRLNVGEQSPLKTGTQTVLQAVNGLWWAVTGHDDLLTGVVEGIECVKEFFFSRLFPGNELNIVNQQNINRPILGAELLCCAIANRIDNFISELLRGDIRTARPVWTPW